MKSLEDVIKDSTRLFLGDRVPEHYLSDPYLGEVKPLYGVALPMNHHEVVGLMEFAKDHQLIVIARGASTGVAGGQVPIHGNELIIDVNLMNQIVELDEETFTLTVEPGVLLGDIHNYVESRGYFYPPDPASKHSTIGGNVATNAGGLRAVKYGTTRDYVRQMTVVLPSGESMTLGSLNIKSSSGYNLLDLFIGSEGTLGVTTEIKLKVLPLPAVRSSILLAFTDVFKATEATLEILSSGANPSEVELFEKDAVFYAEQHLGFSLQTDKGEAYLLVEIDGNDPKELEGRMRLLMASIQDLALEVVSLNEETDKMRAKQIRDNILIGLMAYTEYEMLDEVVPINKFAELIQYTKTLQEKHGLKVLNFGHAGDGNVHTVLMKGDLSDEAWLIKRKALLDDLYLKVQSLGGLPSAEHGIGVVKREYLSMMSDPINLAYMKKIKAVFDPEHRLNPDKVVMQKKD